MCVGFLWYVAMCYGDVNADDNRLLNRGKFYTPLKERCVVAGVMSSVGVNNSPLNVDNIHVQNSRTRF